MKKHKCPHCTCEVPKQITRIEANKLKRVIIGLKKQEAKLRGQIDQLIIKGKLLDSVDIFARDAMSVLGKECGDVTGIQFVSLDSIKDTVRDVNKLLIKEKDVALFFGKDAPKIMKKIVQKLLNMAKLQKELDELAIPFGHVIDKEANYAIDECDDNSRALHDLKMKRDAILLQIKETGKMLRESVIKEK